MTDEKMNKLSELRTYVEYLNLYITKEEILENSGDDIVAITEILLTKVYNLYPDIVRIFE